MIYFSAVVVLSTLLLQLQTADCQSLKVLLQQLAQDAATQHAEVLDKLADIEDQIPSPPPPPPPAPVVPRVGVTYKRWGRTTCAGDATLVYKGFMGKSWFTHGGGVNYLCMPLDPEFPLNKQLGSQTGSYVYGVEYQRWNSDSFFKDVHDENAPCAVCEVQNRTQVLMIPAKKSCPAGWTLEYEGLLAAEHYEHKAAEYVCVSSGMEVRDGGHNNENGGLLYVVEGICGSMPCPPYGNGYELACAVCTK